MYGFPSRESLINEAKSFGLYNPDNRLCIIIGSSRSWAKDYSSFLKSFPGIKFDIIAINKAMIFVENIDHWCSKHPTSYHDAKWDLIRLGKGWENNFKIHSSKIPSDKSKEVNWKRFVDYIWEVYITRGSSAMFAAGVALGMGYRGIITCGVELTGIYRRYLSAFKNFNRAFPHYLKAQSGILKNVCGAPTNQWIKKIIS